MKLFFSILGTLLLWGGIGLIAVPDGRPFTVTLIALFCLFLIVGIWVWNYFRSSQRAKALRIAAGMMIAIHLMIAGFISTWLPHSYKTQKAFEVREIVGDE